MSHSLPLSHPHSHPHFHPHNGSPPITHAARFASFLLTTDVEGKSHNLIKVAFSFLFLFFSFFLNEIKKKGGEKCWRRLLLLSLIYVHFRSCIYFHTPHTLHRLFNYVFLFFCILYVLIFFLSFLFLSFPYFFTFLCTKIFFFLCAVLGKSFTPLGKSFTPFSW